MAFGPPGSENFFKENLGADIGLIEVWLPDFGDCLFTAIDRLLAAHDSAVVLNSDSPTLPTALLVETARVLAQPGDRAVIGPSTDGGYYLLGIKERHRGLFEGISWSTEHVMRQTLQRAEELGIDVHVLPAMVRRRRSRCAASCCAPSCSTACRSQRPMTATPLAHSARLFGRLLDETDLGWRLAEGVRCKGPRNDAVGRGRLARSSSGRIDEPRAAAAPSIPRRYFESRERHGGTAHAPPVCLYLETTNRCNLLCTTCPRTYEELEPPADMSWELFTAHRRPAAEHRARGAARRRRADAGEEPAADGALPQGPRHLRPVQHQRHRAQREERPRADRGRSRRAAGLARCRRPRNPIAPSAARITSPASSRTCAPSARCRSARATTARASRRGSPASRRRIAELPAFVKVAAEIGVKEVYLQRLVFFEERRGRPCAAGPGALRADEPRGGRLSRRGDGARARRSA